MSIEQLFDLCVGKQFSISSTRRAIKDGFMNIVEMLKAQDIRCELVVDGSYLTEEIDPLDIDFAVVVTPAFYEHCSPDQRTLLDWIGDDRRIKDTYLSDCYLCVDYKNGEHEEWFEGLNDRSWWVNLFAKSKVFKRIRGVAIISVPGDQL